MEEKLLEAKPDPSSWSEICIERTRRIENSITSLSDLILVKFVANNERLDLITSVYTNDLDKQQDLLNEQKRIVERIHEQVVLISNQMAGIQQWKTNGERKVDIWYKRQSVQTGFLVLIVGVISNTNKIAAVAKGLLVILGGG